MPQKFDGIAGGGNRDCTWRASSRVGIVISYASFSIGSSTVSLPWPADTAYTGP